MQYRSPVGGGPSKKRWPRCAPQFLHATSVRSILWEVSWFSTKALLLWGAVKLGQPDPESYLSLDLKRGDLHLAQ